MKKIRWRAEKRKLSDLKPFPGNPRKANEKEWNDLKRSLEKFDVADPLVINTDNTVIGGNFRLKVLKEMGVEEVDVRVPDRKLTRKEAEELNLRLNKNTGSWDEELLANFSEDLLREVGWEDIEIEGMKIGDDILESFEEWEFDEGSVNVFFRFGDLKEELSYKDYEDFKKIIEKEGGVKNLIEKLKEYEQN